MAQERPAVGISSCLLGNSVRYDGGHKLDPWLRDTLGQYVRFVPVCPEVECGLAVPREAMRLVGDPGSPRLMTVQGGIDMTARMTRWAERKLTGLAREDLCGFIFKTGSPSSGLRAVKVHDGQGRPRWCGPGLFARAFRERFPLLPVEDEAGLVDPGIRAGFVERVMVFWRWRQLVKDGGTLDGLMRFHEDHTLLLMAHSPSTVSALGKIAASAKGRPRKVVLSDYQVGLMRALAREATRKKHVRVLHHVMRCFEKVLSADEKSELIDVIGEYRRGLAPLAVPIVLLRHHARRLEEPYLARQVYLAPSPVESMVRNHV